MLIRLLYICCVIGSNGKSCPIRLATENFNQSHDKRHTGVFQWDSGDNSGFYDEAVAIGGKGLRDWWGK